MSLPATPFLSSRTTDVATVKNLELIANTHNPSSGHSLFGVLDHTKTAMGSRLVRSNILQPPLGEGVEWAGRRVVMGFNYDIHFCRSGDNKPPTGLCHRWAG